MPKFTDFIPEIASFIVGLLLTFLGVPSITDIGIWIISGFQNAFQNIPNTPSQAFTIMTNTIWALRFLGAFAEIELPLRIIIWYSRREEYIYQWN